jgi:hypothetical protein
VIVYQILRVLWGRRDEFVVNCVSENHFSLFFASPGGMTGIKKPGVAPGF